ncbi:hypothetical protein [Nonomuraea rhizosphaerae]|uniref:hypothetical protein n=1 Tax=Nonomuraea rhizosphaerae TaxID=2665663 RepID=UPI003558CE1F
MGTTDVARDVDSIRAALGEKQISFFAISYGTQVGQQYAKLFPMYKPSAGFFPLAERLKALAAGTGQEARKKAPSTSASASADGVNSPIRPSGAPTGSGTSGASPSWTPTSAA